MTLAEVLDRVRGFESDGWAVSGLGVLLTLFVVGGEVLRPSNVWLPAVAVELNLAAVLVYGGYWLTTSEIDPDQTRRINRWCLTGLAYSGTFALIAAVVSKGAGLWSTNSFFLFDEAITSGAVIGLVIGLSGAFRAVGTRPAGRTPLAEDEEHPEFPTATRPPLPPPNVPASVFDDWLKVLSDPRCRTVLRILESTSGNLETDDIVAGMVRQNDEASATTSHRRTVEAELNHAVLPKLSDVGLIDYDARTKTVRYQRHPALDAWLTAVAADR